MKKHLIFEKIIVILIILTATLLNLWHIIYRFLTRPVGSVFIGISHYHEDYFYYLTQLTQGAMGAWKTSNLYSTDRIPPVFLWFPNILLGKLSAILNIPVWDMYSLSLIFITIISLIVLYYASYRIFPKSPLLRLSSFAVCVFASQFYIVKNPGNTYQIIPFDFFYSYTRSLNRLGGVFHLMLQNILTLLIIIVFADILNFIFYQANFSRKLTIRIITASFLLLLLMFINPMYAAVDAIVIAIVAFLYFLFSPHKLRSLNRLIITAVIVGLPLLIPVKIIIGTFSESFYVYFRWAENQIRPATPYLFFSSMGIITPLIVLGLPVYLKQGSILRVLGVFWAIFQIALYLSPIPNRLIVPYFRIPQPPAYAFLAASSVCGLMGISTLIGKIIRIKIANILFVFLVLTFLLFQIPVISVEVNERLNQASTTSFLNYPPPGLISGLSELKKAPLDLNTLAINTVEFLVPVFSGHKVFAAHRSLTYQYPEKISQVAQFYFLKMTPEEALNFLNTNNIGYVIWHKADGDGYRYLTAYPFLKIWYENEAVIIFGIKN